jgi:hypothetical protein
MRSFAAAASLAFLAAGCGPANAALRVPPWDYVPDLVREDCRVAPATTHGDSACNDSRLVWVALPEGKPPIAADGSGERKWPVYIHFINDPYPATNQSDAKCPVPTEKLRKVGPWTTPTTAMESCYPHSQYRSQQQQQQTTDEEVTLNNPSPSPTPCDLDQATGAQWDIRLRQVCDRLVD